MEVIKFFFDYLPHFVGMCVVLYLIGESLAKMIYAARHK